MSPRLRLQKRDSHRAFSNALRALHVLGRAGLPVPEILAEGPDHYVMSDVGPTLAQMLRSSATPFAKRAAAFRAAGAALGRLHTAGFVHGRPALRDICWDGEEARFIDLERFSEMRQSAVRRALDVAMFTQTYMAEMSGPGPYLDLAIAAYRTQAPAGAMADVRKLGRWLAPMGPISAPARWLRPDAKEIKAIPRTIAYLRQLSA